MSKFSKKYWILLSLFIVIVIFLEFYLFLGPLSNTSTSVQSVWNDVALAFVLPLIVLVIFSVWALIHSADSKAKKKVAAMSYVEQKEKARKDKIFILFAFIFIILFSVIFHLLTKK